MDNFSVCICLCVYNNQKGLNYVIRNLEMLIPLFKDTQIIFFYDISSDNSLELLQKLQIKYSDMNNIHIIQNPNERLQINTTEKNKKYVSNMKTKNIAVARNGLIDYVYTKFSTYDYFIMMDANEYSCIGELTPSILSEVFTESNLEKWDSVSFDRESGYYDFLALSYNDFIYSFFHFVDTNKVVNEMRKDFLNRLNKYKNLLPNEFIPVFSAFNGFAIYKLSKFINCRYNTEIKLELFPTEKVKNQCKLMKTNIHPHFDDDCEHRRFHYEGIRYNNAKIRIYPKSIFKKVINPDKSLCGPA